MKNDKKALIAYRGIKTFVIMNKYPYNSGHVMVVPYRHTGTVLRLDDEESLEMMQTLQLTVKAIKKSLHPESFNIGMNMGRFRSGSSRPHAHARCPTVAGGHQLYAGDRQNQGGFFRARFDLRDA